MPTYAVRRLPFALTFIVLLSHIVIPPATSAQNVVFVSRARTEGAEE